MTNATVPHLGVAVLMLFGTFAAGPTAASVPATVAKEVIEATVDRAATRSGRSLEGAAARRAATEQVGRLAVDHGSDVLKVVEDSGLELLEALPRFGDELLQLAKGATPAARRALALNPDELVPLARRVGMDAIELEARVPGQAANVFRIFGDDGGKTVARTVRTEDLPRIIKYGEMADSSATRKLLLETYQKEGASLFRRIPPKLVLASGLTAAMLYGTHELTKAIRNQPDILRGIVNHATTVLGGVALLTVLLLLWRFGLMPWHRTQPKANSARGANAHSHLDEGETTKHDSRRS